MKIKLTENQLNKVINRVINEQGLYGSQSDVVDYDLPEFLSDTIILQSVNDWSDVEKSLKEIHKRLIRIEKGLTTAGSHNKAYSTGGNYSFGNKKEKEFETAIDSIDRDEKLKMDIEKLRQDLEL
tara:strand:+ start:135 stop:509 length:375 start_codon:yes stop_codon:yes gene_type:complete